MTTRLAGHLGALFLGAGACLASIAVHRVAVLGLPLGLLLAVVASSVTAWHLRGGDAPRLTCTYCLGWVGVLGLALNGRPEGDFVVSGDVAGYTLMGVGFVLVALGVATLAGRGQPGTHHPAA